jgi:hypothetical protein
MLLIQISFVVYQFYSLVSLLLSISNLIQSKKALSRTFRLKNREQYKIFLNFTLNRFIYLFIKSTDISRTTSREGECQIYPPLDPYFIHSKIINIMVIS